MRTGAAAKTGRLYDSLYKRLPVETRCGDNFALRLGANGYRRLDEALADAAFLKSAVSHGGVILDLGCGTGGYGAWLARRLAGAPVGIDASFQAARQAMQRHPVGAFVQGDACRLPLTTGCIAAAISLDVLHCLDRPERLFEELARVLKPGGRAVVTGLATDGRSEPAQTQAGTWRALARRAGLHERACEDATLPWRHYMTARHTARLAQPGDWSAEDLAVSRAMLARVITHTLRICLRLEARA
jgi:SAM-dependent methyltransferase